MLDNLKKYKDFGRAIIITTFIVLVISLGFLIKNYYSDETLPVSVYVIAMDETWYPLQVYDNEEYLSRFSVDIVQSIAAEQHFTAQVVSVEPGDLLSGIDSGEYEGILSSIILSEEDAVNYLSSKPYFLLGPVLVVSTTSNIKSLKDIKGASIGIIRGFGAINSLDNYVKTNFIFYDYSDRFKLIDDVINNVVDGMILDIMTAHELTASGFDEGRLKIVSAPINNNGLRLIVKNTPEYKRLINKFNEGLKVLKQNGLYDKLLKKWKLFNPEKHGS